MKPKAILQTETGSALPTEIPNPRSRHLFTVTNFAERHDSFLTVAALQNLIFKAKTRTSTKGDIPGNGMEEAGAIVRIAGRVLIDEDAYFRWVDSLQQGGK